VTTVAEPDPELLGLTGISGFGVLAKALHLEHSPGSSSTQFHLDAPEMVQAYTSSRGLVFRAPAKWVNELRL
jgi:hypothetical protein